MSSKVERACLLPGDLKVTLVDRIRMSSRALRVSTGPQERDVFLGVVSTARIGFPVVSYLCWHRSPSRFNADTTSGHSSRRYWISPGVAFSVAVRCCRRSINTIYLVLHVTDMYVVYYWCVLLPRPWWCLTRSHFSRLMSRFVEGDVSMRGWDTVWYTGAWSEIGSISWTRWLNT